MKANLNQLDFHCGRGRSPTEGKQHEHGGLLHFCSLPTISDLGRLVAFGAAGLFVGEADAPFIYTHE